MDPFKLKPEVISNLKLLSKFFPSKAGGGFKFGLRTVGKHILRPTWAEARVAGLEAQQEAVEEGKGWWRCG